MKNLYNPNRRRFTILIPLAIIFASVTTLYCVPRILQSERFEDEEMRKNRLLIENMPKIERDRLRRKFKNFEDLSEDRKETFRQLHEELLEDRKKGGNLTEVLQNYDKWLLTLTPQQQAEIKSSKSYEDRMELVDVYLLEQEEKRQQEEWQNSRSIRFRGFSFFRNRNFQRFLSANSVSGMKLTMNDVGEIARHLEKELKIYVDLGKLKDSKNKYLVVLSNVLEAHKKSEEQKKVGYIDDVAIVVIMEKSNANPNLIAKIKKSAEISDGKYDVLKDVLNTIRYDWRSQYRKDKKEYIRSLAKDVQIEIRTQSPREQKVRLAWEFFKKRAPEYTKLMRTYYINYHLRDNSSRSKNQQGDRSRSGKRSKRKLFR